MGENYRSIFFWQRFHGKENRGYRSNNGKFCILKEDKNTGWYLYNTTSGTLKQYNSMRECRRHAQIIAEESF